MATIERRRFDGEEDRYHSATFPASELESIEQAAKAAREYLNPPPRQAASANGRHSPGTSAEKPRFIPNRSAMPSPSTAVSIPTRPVEGPSEVRAGTPTGDRHATPIESFMQCPPGTDPTDPTSAQQASWPGSLPRAIAVAATPPSIAPFRLLFGMLESVAASEFLPAKAGVLLRGS